MTDVLVISVLTLSFTIFLVIGVPISIGIGLSSFAALLVVYTPDLAMRITAQKMITALDSFPLLAIPFFVLAGNIMNKGGIARRLVNFAKVLVGPLPGALIHCNVVANMMFGAISGSAVSAIAGVGGMLGPIQKKEGYDPAFAAAVNVASGPTGLLIPPSNIMIVYSIVSGGTSIGALFLAGYIPGILMGLGVMLIAGYMAAVRSYPVNEKIKLKEFLQRALDAIPSLTMILFVIGGMISGIFTATEASAVAVIYCLGLAMIYRELKWKELPEIFLSTVLATTIVLFVIGSSMAMGYVISIANIPDLVSAWLEPFADYPWMVLLIINIVLLIVGTFMDMTPAVLIFTPVFLPIVKKFGMDPIHFGIIMIFNQCIGLYTPPVGNALFVGCSVAGVPIGPVVRYLMPIFVVMFIVLMLVTYIPGLSLWLPKYFGLL